MFKYRSSTPAYTQTPSSLFTFPLALSPLYGCKSKQALQPRPTCSLGGWVLGMQVQSWLERERGGESFIVGLDSTLSPLEHPLMGKPTDNHILIWLCKYLLQKAIRCNPYPVVERQSKGGGRKGRGSSRNVKRKGWMVEFLRELNISAKGTGSFNDSAILHATAWHMDQFTSHIFCSTRGGLRTKQYTLTHSEWPMTPSTGHWIQYSNAYCFSRRSCSQRQKESTMLMRGPKHPELRFRHRNSRWWHFPRTELQHYWFLKALSTTPPLLPNIHTKLTPLASEEGLQPRKRLCELVRSV